MSTYTHVPHPRTLERLEPKDQPVKAAVDAATRFNSWLAVKITNGVGTMWCAYIFAIVAFIGLPTALKPGGQGIISWIAQTFLQLVLLSIIIVGQNIAAASSDERSENTFKDAEAILSEAIEIQKHLQSQDREGRTREAPASLIIPLVIVRVGGPTCTIRLEDQVLENLTSTWRKGESGRIHGQARLMGDIARSSLADTTLKGVDQPPVAPWAPQSDQLEKLSHNKALAKVK